MVESFSSRKILAPRQLPSPDDAWVRGGNLGLDAKPRVQEASTRRTEQQYRGGRDDQKNIRCS